MSVDWNALRKRLVGRLVTPNEINLYNQVRQVFNARVDRKPAAVALVAVENDVQECVKFCAENGVKITSRCGGHGALGYAILDDELTIDMSGLQYIHTDLDQLTVTAGGGTLWGQIDLATYGRGLASSGGGCPIVGVGGLTQGGGFGPFSRVRGLTCDNLISARIVTGDGSEVLSASASENAPLFWALRGGGGGNWGVITEFKYQLHPITHAFTAGGAVYAWEDTKQVWAFCRDWMRSQDARPALMVQPAVGFDGNGDPLCFLTMIYDGDWLEGLNYIQQLMQEYKMPAPLSGPIETLLGPITLPAFTATEALTAWPGQAQYWKSGFLRNDFEDAAIDTIKSYMEKAPKPPMDATRALSPQTRSPNTTFGFIETLGGAVAQKQSDETAFCWRDRLFSFTFIGVYPPDDPGLGAEVKAWADEFRTAMAPHYDADGAVYVNYLQDGLPNWKRAYYGDNVDRLMATKRKYDPKHIFCFPQDVLQPG